MSLLMSGNFEAEFFFKYDCRFLLKLGVLPGAYSLFPNSRAAKTLRLHDPDGDVGYINEQVIKRNGLIGFHFGRWPDGSGDHMPERFEKNIQQEFVRQYGGNAADFEVHSGSNGLYLVIKNLDLALKAIVENKARMRFTVAATS